METSTSLLIVPEIQAHYSSPKKVTELPVIRSSADAYQIFQHHWNENQIELLEEFKVLVLSRSHAVLGICPISKGGYSGTVVDPKLVFALALRVKASALICCHNHPSGKLVPSRADQLLTQKLKQAGELLELPLLDHLIITKGGYYSFSDEGAL